MIKVVADSVMNKYNADFGTVLTGGLYYQQAPTDVTSPYSVFYINGITTDEIMGAADQNITDVELQFNLFSTSNDGGLNLAAIVDRFIDVMDWTTMSLADSWYCVRMQRENLINLGYVDEIWQVSLIYMLGISKV